MSFGENYERCILAMATWLSVITLDSSGRSRRQSCGDNIPFTPGWVAASACLHTLR